MVYSSKLPYHQSADESMLRSTVVRAGYGQHVYQLADGKIQVIGRKRGHAHPQRCTRLTILKCGGA